MLVTLMLVKQPIQEHLISGNSVIIQSILQKKLAESYRLIDEKMRQIVEQKLLERKKKIAATIQEEDETEVLEEGPRVKIVKARIRNGKIQRRKKISNVSGFTMRGGRITKMSVTERRNRRMGQKRGKIKRKAKQSRTLRKRKVSLMKRKRLGIG